MSASLGPSPHGEGCEACCQQEGNAGLACRDVVAAPLCRVERCLAEQLYWSARELKAAWLRTCHSDRTEEQIAQEVRRLFTNART